MKSNKNEALSKKSSDFWTVILITLFFLFCTTADSWFNF